MTLLVLHHTPDVGLGALAEPIEQRDVEIRHADLGDTASLALEGVTGVLALGGSPAHQGFPEPELALLHDAAAAQLPVFGICGGAEALALALGGEVVARQSPEVAFVPLHRTVPGREDPVTAGWPDGARALAMHRREVVRLPAGADQLLIGSDGPSLWRFGSVWATALNLEADVPTVETWVAGPDGPALLDEAGVDADALLDETRRRERFVRAAGVSLVLRWLDGQVSA